MRSRLVAVFAGALLLAGLIAGPVTTPRVAAQTPLPGIQVLLGPNAIFGSGPWTNGQTVSVTIDDPLTLLNPDFGPANSGVVGQPCPPGPCGPGGWVVPVPSYVIKADDKVSAVSPSASVTNYVVENLSITEVDYGPNNWVKGTANAGRIPRVTVGPFAADRYPTAAGVPGRWTADFKVPTLYDLTPGQTILAILGVPGSGGTTVAFAPPPPPPDVGSVSGTVVGPDGPVVGGRVFSNASPPNTPPPGQYLTSTDAVGRFVTPPLNVGTYSLRFEGQPGSGLVGTAVVTVVKDITTPLDSDVNLVKLPSIWGTIKMLDENDQPVFPLPLPPGSDAVSNICMWQGPVGYGCIGMFLGRTADPQTGLFQHTELAPGTYTTSGFTLFGGWPQPQGTPIVSLELAAGDQVECTFILRANPNSTKARSAECVGATGGDGDGLITEGPTASYDGNGDGKPDVSQGNVATLPSSVDPQYVTIAAPDGMSLVNVTALNPASLNPLPPKDANVPFGAFGFTLLGGRGFEADVTLYLPDTTPPIDAYFKFQNSIWTQFESAVITAGGTRVALHLVDGRAGDGDGTANGVIVDPGAPADVFDFAGFFAPVDDLPVLNSVKAGRAIPVKFSLGGDQGLDIFAAGYPKSRSIDCDSQAPVDAIETTVDNAGNSTLTYDQSSQRYQFVWKTDKAWAGCRLLTLKLSDGTTHLANFKFN